MNNRLRFPTEEWERSTPSQQCPISIDRTEEDGEATEEQQELDEVIPPELNSRPCAEECEFLSQGLERDRRLNRINGSVDPCGCGGACACQFFSQSNEFYSQTDYGPSIEPEKCKPSTPSHWSSPEWGRLFQQTYGMDLTLDDAYFNTPGNEDAAQRILAQEELMTDEEFVAELGPFAAVEILDSVPSQDSLVQLH